MKIEVPYGLGEPDDIVVYTTSERGHKLLTGWRDAVGGVSHPIWNWEDMDEWFNNPKVSLRRRLLEWAKREFVIRGPLFDGAFSPQSVSNNLNATYADALWMIETLVSLGKLVKRACRDPHSYALPAKVRVKLYKDFKMSVWNPATEPID